MYTKNKRETACVIFAMLIKKTKMGNCKQNSTRNVLKYAVRVSNKRLCDKAFAISQNFLKPYQKVMHSIKFRSVDFAMQFKD